jgi:FAD/FMN-containing dehydrogenase
VIVGEPSPTTARPEIDDEALATLQPRFRGQLLRPHDDGYEAARHIWNGMIDKHPALIARCTGTSDVVAAVRFAREQGLEIAVRGGGHNVAGNAVNDGGIVIDLSLMKGIHVEPARRVARAQAGVVWGELDRETQRYGLATPGGVVSGTGIAGFTLSGGMALTSSKWGLACDNLLSIEIVTADGEVLQASMTEHPDLFWAVRGGGGNFGIVTWFEYRLHPIGPEVFVVGTLYALSDAAQITPAWRDYVLQTPDEVTSTLVFWSMPSLPVFPAELHGVPIVGAYGLYAGDPTEAEAALQPLREFATPLIDLSGRADYLTVQNTWDVFFPTTLRYYWKSLFLDELQEADIAQTIALAEARPTPDTLFALRHLGGAVGRIPDDATAFANRRSPFNLSIDTTWSDPADDARMIGWTRRAWQELRDRTGGGVYLNFAGLGEENELLARAGHGGNYERLRAVKRRYDPQNVFRGNINIRL